MVWCFAKLSYIQWLSARKDGPHCTKFPLSRACKGHSISRLNLITSIISRSQREVVDKNQDEKSKWGFKEGHGGIGKHLARCSYFSFWASVSSNHGNSKYYFHLITVISWADYLIVVSKTLLRFWAIICYLIMTNNDAPFIDTSVNI